MKKVTFEKVIHMLCTEYEHAERNTNIHKPLAWALYQTWKYADGEEKTRNPENEDS